MSRIIILAFFPLLVSAQLNIIHSNEDTPHHLQINDDCVFKNNLYLGTYFTYPANQTFTGFWKLNSLQNDIELQKDINVMQVAATDNFMLIGGFNPGLNSTTKLYLSNDGINIQEIPYQEVSLSMHQVIDDKIYFSGYNWGGNGNILSTDGTIEGTKNYTVISNLYHHLIAEQFVKFGGQVYFVGVNGNGQWGLYSIINDQIQLVFDGIYKVIVQDNKMYLCYYTTSGWKMYFAKFENNQIIWKNVVHKNGPVIIDRWSYFSEMSFLDNKLITAVALPYQQENLFEVVDDSMKIVKALNNDIFASRIRFLGKVNNKLIFQSSNPENSKQCLWQTDGTNDGTSILRTDASMGSNPGGSNYPAHSRKVISYSDRLFFVGNSTKTGLEIFYTDGTTNGTQTLIEVNPGPSSSNPSDMIIYDNKLFFEGINATGNVRIFKYNFKCLTEKSVTSNESNVTESEKRIISNQKIENLNIEYRTNNSILLKEGFETKGNSVFKTSLQAGCLFE